MRSRRPSGLLAAFKCYEEKLRRGGGLKSRRLHVLAPAGRPGPLQRMRLIQADVSHDRAVGGMLGRSIPIKSKGTAVKTRVSVCGCGSGVGWTGDLRVVRIFTARLACG
jgi:hypothetical protein